MPVDAVCRQRSLIVGYQEIAVPQGSSMRTATFKAISGNYKISDIQVNGAAGGGMDYAQKIRVLWQIRKGVLDGSLRPVSAVRRA